MAVREIQTTESTFASWQNTGIYQFNSSAGTTSLLSGYSPSTTLMRFYEVSVIDGNEVDEGGSWFLATAPSSQVPQAWWDNGGAEQLQAEGSGIPVVENGEPIMRPVVLFWWVPVVTLANLNVNIEIRSGSILGPVPLLAPQQGSSGNEIVVQRTSNGVILTLPPTSGETVITVAMDS